MNGKKTAVSNILFKGMTIEMVHRFLLFKFNDSPLCLLYAFTLITRADSSHRAKASVPWEV